MRQYNVFFYSTYFVDYALILCIYHSYIISNKISNMFELILNLETVPVYDDDSVNWFKVL